MTVSYQAQSPVLGLVLPSNSPGVHTLWLPVIPMQIGLVLKPGPQEPWTPYRMAAAFFEAGVPREAISIYPGRGDIGAEVVRRTCRSMIFGGTATVERYKGDPRVQVHGPGFSKILLGDDVVDHWETYLDVMADSVFANSGRGCINCSGIWASRHTREIAQALAERIGPDRAETARGSASQPCGVHGSRRGQGDLGKIEANLDEHGRRACHRPLWSAAGREGTLRLSASDGDPLRVLRAGRSPIPSSCFRSSSVVECPQEEMLKRIGPTLVCSAITQDPQFQRTLIDAQQIDRLNIGAIPTIKLDWLQPHEGNIVEFLFRPRAFQVAAV